MHADSLTLWNGHFQNTYVVDYLCTYATDNRTMIVYDIMTWKKNVLTEEACLRTENGAYGRESGLSDYLY